MAHTGVELVTQASRKYFQSSSVPLLMRMNQRQQVGKAVQNRLSIAPQ
jgi:hypothetical protein